MIFLEYFLLATTTVLVVFAQQPNMGDKTRTLLQEELESIERSNRAQETIEMIKQSSQENQDASIFSDATLVLRNGYINGTHHISVSENKIMKEICEAKKLIVEDPECVKKIMQQAFPDARTELFKAVRPFFQSFGEAVAMTNDGTKYGLGSASILLQKAGFAIFDAIKVAENLFNAGIETGGNAGPVLLEAVRLALEMGFAGTFHKIQESIIEANQALKDAQCSPMQGQMDNLHCDCEAAGNDPESSDAVNQINEASNNALQRGANPQLVQKLKEVMMCVIGDLVNVTAKGKQALQTIEQMAGNETLSTIRITSFNQAEDIKKVVHSIAANIYLILGDIALQSGNQSKGEIGDAILAIELSKIDTFLGVETAEDLIGIGLSYGGDAPKFAIEAAAQSQLYGKIALIQGIAKSATLVLSVL